jgi:hypothetical protein
VTEVVAALFYVAYCEYHRRLTGKSVAKREILYTKSKAVLTRFSSNTFKFLDIF